MKLHHLQYLVAAADRGSVRGAALEVGVSSTAVSRALIELENLAGVPLLERKAEGVELTAAGRAVLSHARQVMSQLKAADETLANLRGSVHTRLAIGVTPWVTQTLLGPSLQMLVRQRPDVRLDVHEVLGTDYRALREGSIDIAIGLMPLQSATEFNARPLFSYGSAVICRIGHPLAQVHRLAELEGQDWLLSREIEQHSPVMQSLLTGMQEAPRVHYARSALAATAIVRSTDMLAICPWPLVESDRVRGTVQALHLHDELPEHVTGLLTRHNFAASGVVREFVDCLMTVIDQARQSPEPSLRRIFSTLSSPSSD